MGKRKKKKELLAAKIRIRRRGGRASQVIRSKREKLADRRWREELDLEGMAVGIGLVAVWGAQS